MTGLGATSLTNSPVSHRTQGEACKSQTVREKASDCTDYDVIPSFWLIQGLSCCDGCFHYCYVKRTRCCKKQGINSPIWNLLTYYCHFLCEGIREKKPNAGPAGSGSSFLSFVKFPQVLHPSHMFNLCCYRQAALVGILLPELLPCETVDRI